MNIVIMAGGTGTRFWPKSMESKPKQFLSLTSHQTMIQETYGRFRAWLPAEHIYVVTTRQYKPLVLEQLPGLSEEQLILEPESKDTGPCIALTAIHFLEKNDNDVLVTIPSDQYIPNGDALMKALFVAERVADEEQAIVTLGITPTRPETGYGYIVADEGTDERPDPVHIVQRFIEKPPHAQAMELTKRSNVFWNSGIFVWKPSTIERNMKAHQLDMWTTLKQNYAELDTVYAQLSKISVDYAILEKADRIFTIPVQFEWDDVGAWTSLERVYEPDAQGNIIAPDEDNGMDVHTLLTTNSIIVSDKPTLVIGVKDIIIVSTRDGLLVCHKSEEQTIKKLVNGQLRGGTA